MGWLVPLIGRVQVWDGLLLGRCIRSSCRMIGICAHISAPQMLANTVVRWHTQHLCAAFYACCMSALLFIYTPGQQARSKSAALYLPCISMAIVCALVQLLFSAAAAEASVPWLDQATASRLRNKRVTASDGLVGCMV